METLSDRGAANVREIFNRMPRHIREAPDEFEDSSTSINLSMAENILIRDEVNAILQTAISKRLQPETLNWPSPLMGNPRLLRELSKVFNNHFSPYHPIEPSHLALAPGAAACLSTLLFNTCNPGDGVLLLSPHWKGNDVFFQIQSHVTSVAVSFNPFDSDQRPKIRATLMEAFVNAPCPVKALVISNPHNPFGCRYEKETLEECMVFCAETNLHFISDEVFILNPLNASHHPAGKPLTSVLSLDPPESGCHPSRVHVIWSLSKAFAATGLRLGCVVSPSNKSLLRGIALMESANISTISTLCAEALLADANVSFLLKLSSVRCRLAHKKLTAFFVELGIPYLSCDAGLAVMAKIVPSAQTWEDEARMVNKLLDASVIVSAGQTYHMWEPGWARISFGVTPNELDKAIQIMRPVLTGMPIAKPVNGSLDKPGVPNDTKVDSKSADDLKKSDNHSAESHLVNAMAKVGVIGGVSWESTVLYYEHMNKRVQKRLGGYHSANVLIHSVDFAEMEALAIKNDWDEIGTRLGVVARGLAENGAQAIVLACNTLHAVADRIAQDAGVEFLHIADVTAQVVKEQSIDNVVLIGSKYTLQGDFIHGRMREHGINVVLPDPKWWDEIHRVIMEELVLGHVRAESKNIYGAIIKELVEQHKAQGIVLACTEIGLLINEDDFGVPIFDTAKIHADKAADWAIEHSYMSAPRNQK